MSDETYKLFRVTISSGTGENRLRRAVVLHYPKPPDGENWPDGHGPTIEMVENALTSLKGWVVKHGRGITDWTVVGFETFYSWPSKDE